MYVLIKYCCCFFSAHWFLAIICFPGMERPQSVRYLFVSNQDSSSSSPVQKMAIQAETVSSSDDTNKVRLIYIVYICFSSHFI